MKAKHPVISGPEHVRLAEDCLRAARDAGAVMERQYLLAEAGVHAALAKVMLDASLGLHGGRFTHGDHAAWTEVVNRG